MKNIAVVAVVLPIALLVGACNQDGKQRVAGPDLAGSEEPSVLEASWVESRDQVAQAASIAAAHPMIQSALTAAGQDRLAYQPQFALRATGRSSADERVSVTILPYATDGDQTHGTFLSLIERGRVTAVSRAEILWGRDPRQDEIGFELFIIRGVRAWIREEDPVVSAAGRLPNLGAEVINKAKFLACFGTLGPMLCSQGAQIANETAPGFPYREAIGCAAGTAVAAITCAIKASDGAR